MAFGIAEAAKLAVDLSLKGNFASSLATSQKALKSFDGQVSTTSTRAYRAGQQIGTGIKSGAIIAAGGVALLASQVALGLASLSRLDDVVAQTNAVLKSTKGAAGENAQAIRDLANKYESLNATIDDTVIQSGENLLLTFTNIRKQAFEPALLAALNVNQALGRGESGLTGTVRALGRALNDPAKGLVQLTRLGITLSASQQKQVKDALKVNDTYKAQTIILGALNTKFGGSFLAGGQTTSGKVAKFKDAIDDLQRALAQALLPTIGKVADRLSEFLGRKDVTDAVTKLGQSIAGLFSDQNIAEGGRILSSVFDTAKAAAPVLLQTGQAMLGLVKAAVGIFQSLPAPLQQLAVGAFAVNKLTGGLVTNVAGGIVGAILGQLKSAVVNVEGAVVNVNGVGIPGAGAAPGVGAIAGGISAGSLAAGFSIALAPVVAGLAILAVQGDAKVAADDKRSRELIAATRGLNPNNVAPNIQTGGPKENALVSGDIRHYGSMIAAIANKQLGTEASAGKKLDDLTRKAQANVTRTAAVRDKVESTRIAVLSAARGNAHVIAGKIADDKAAVTRAIASAARAQRIAANQTTQAVKDKDLSIRVGPTYITNKLDSAVIGRTIVRARKIMSTYS